MPAWRLSTSRAGRGEPPPGWLVPRLASDVASCARPVVLVMDNADHITDRSIVAGLDLLVRQAGNRLRLVLCARADPLLPLHRYRLAGTLSEIRSDELSFTPDETSELLTAMGVPGDRGGRAGPVRGDAGLGGRAPAGRGTLKQGVPPERLVTSLARDDGSVAQYLFAEVLEGQPAGVRRVLLRTSVTPELWPDLVDRLCGRRNVRRVLAGLAHANAFVEESPGAPGGFRIHPSSGRCCRPSSATSTRRSSPACTGRAPRGTPSRPSAGGGGARRRSGGLGLRHPPAHRRPAGHPPAGARDRTRPCAGCESSRPVCAAPRPR